MDAEDNCILGAKIVFVALKLLTVIFVIAAFTEVNEVAVTDVPCTLVTYMSEKPAPTSDDPKDTPVEVVGNTLKYPLRASKLMKFV